ncbi:MAG TPA: SMC-Scp complex subunit ScpB [Methanomassiliicoccales archaeon]|nr:SMC-Scp complex subunit ScpB [Methanomassiliicoccales archaeon]
MERAVEAVLFAASQPLRAADIADICGIGPEAVRKEIRRLDKEYEERGTAFEIAKIGQRYSLQLRQQYNQYALPFADLEMSPEVLKTASIIAYNQPILQSDLVKMLGSGVYERVKALRQMGLVTGKHVGQSLLLSTTREFSEKFGLGTKKEEIKEWMESKQKQQ